MLLLLHKISKLWGRSLCGTFFRSPHRFPEVLRSGLWLLWRRCSANLDVCFGLLSDRKEKFIFSFLTEQRLVICLNTLIDKFGIGNVSLSSNESMASVEIIIFQDVAGRLTPNQCQRTYPHITWVSLVYMLHIRNLSRGDRRSGSRWATSAPSLHGLRGFSTVRDVLSVGGLMLQQGIKPPSYIRKRVPL